MLLALRVSRTGWLEANFPSFLQDLGKLNGRCNKYLNLRVQHVEQNYKLTNPPVLSFKYFSVPLLISYTLLFLFGSPNSSI